MQKRLSGFSLMEMMIVLLIVAIVAAASAPMINKKMLMNVGEKTPWVWTGLGNNIAYNLQGAEQTAIIGSIKTRNSAIKPGLYVESKQTGTNLTPQISLGTDSNSSQPMYISTANNAIQFNNEQISLSGPRMGSIAIGYGTKIQNVQSTAIGWNAHTDSTQSVAIGAGVTANGQKSIAIGEQAYAKENAMAIGTSTKENNTDILVQASTNSIAMGIGARAATTTTTTDSIAIGTKAKAASNSVAIGNMANATKNNASLQLEDYSTAIGYDAQAIGQYTTSYGCEAKASNVNSTAVGYNSKAINQSASAFGHNAQAEHLQSTAIGFNAKTNTRDQVVLGDDNAEVYIPGTLKVKNLDLSEM